MPKGVYPRKPRPILPRFEAKYVPEPNSGCFIWIGSDDQCGGYGKFGMSHKESPIGAHRASWLLYNGEIPEGMFVLHRCDNPPCVNPEHLYLGTAKDNTADMIRKNRRVPPPYGESHKDAKLTAAQAREIRSSTLNNGVLAKMYGIDRSGISRIKTGHNWKRA